jgi:hypothetical protein
LTWEFPFWSGIAVAVIELIAAGWVINRRRTMKRATATS